MLPLRQPALLLPGWAFWASMLAAAACAAAGAPTKLALPSVLTSDAVLPAAGATIWGWAVPGAKVEVSVAGAHTGSYSATTNMTDGAWEVALPAVAPSLELSSITVSSGTEKHVLQGVLFGELILCGGQVLPYCRQFAHRTS